MALTLDDLNSEQRPIADAIIKHLNHGTGALVVSGKAGTGKTSLVVAALPNIRGTGTQPIVVGAFTGKATSILKRKLVAAGINIGPSTQIISRTLHSIAMRPDSKELDEVCERLLEIDEEIEQEQRLYVARTTENAVHWSKTDDGIKAYEKRASVDKEMTEIRRALGGDVRFVARDVREFLQKPDETSPEDEIADTYAFGDEKPTLAEKERQAPPRYSAIVADEASMIDYDLMNGLRNAMEAGIPVVFLGDKNQLPPVNVNSKTLPSGLNTPDFELTTIMRQAAANTIIPFAHEVTNIKRVQRGSGLVSMPPNVTAIPFMEPDAVMSVPGFEDAQYIAYTNKMRHRYNQLLRERKFQRSFTADDYFPMIGEEIIIDANIAERSLFKGDRATVLQLVREVDLISHKGSIDDPMMVAYEASGANSAGGGFTEYRAMAELHFPDYDKTMWMLISVNDMLATYNNALHIEMNAKRADNRDRARFRKMIYKTTPVTYSYCLTSYKSQGSEWDNVVVIHDCAFPQTRRAHLYTGATRAKSNLLVAGV